MNKESIVLGSGDLYCTEFEGTDKELPTNEVLETEENRLGQRKILSEKMLDKIGLIR